MPKKTTIELGKIYKEKIHGIQGVATSHTRYLTGCDRVCLEWLKDGEVKYHYADISILEGVEIADADKKPGGPAKAPPSRDCPRR